MAVSQERFTVSTTPVALNPVSTGGTRLTIRNDHASAHAVLGNSAVTNTTGLKLPFGQVVTVKVSGGDQLYALREAAADTTLHVLRT